LHVPAGYSDDREYPLIIALHGTFKTASRFENETGLSQIADRKGYVVAYPEGIGILRFLQHWNAGLCCGKAARDQVDDVGFITWVINDVGTRLAIDRHRIYLIGFSNGGMLAYRFGAEKPNKVAAIAVLSAAIGSRPGPEAPMAQVNPPNKPVPLIVFHGREDPLIPYGGGRAVGRKGQREYIAVEDTIRAWARGNGCGSTPKMRYLQGGAVTEDKVALCRPESFGGRLLFGRLGASLARR
jgi:polyhydroxybutyrate depolymerase